MKYIYLHGFASSPASTKARWFEARFAELGIGLEVPQLAPDFERMTLSSELERVFRSMDGASGVTLLGSSMGGYLAALAASREPRVERLVLLAAAFDLPARLEGSIGGERAQEWRQTGKLRVFHYGENRELFLGYDLVRDAAQYPGYPDVCQPALLLHGRHDPVVPLQLAEEFTSRASNRRLVVYDSGHELTDVLPAMWDAVRTFLRLPAP